MGMYDWVYLCVCLKWFHFQRFCCEQIYAEKPFFFLQNMRGLGHILLGIKNLGSQAIGCIFRTSKYSKRI